MEHTGIRAIFIDHVHFLERQARILQDPIFGVIQDTSTKKRLSKATTRTSKLMTNSKQKSRVSSFTTTVAVMEKDNEECSSAGNIMQMSKVS